MRKTFLNIWIVILVAVFISYSYQTYEDSIVIYDLKEKQSFMKLKNFEVERIDNSTVASKLIFKFLI